MVNEVRGSGVSAFLQCPAYGTWKGLSEAHAGPVHCGTLCGTLAHHKVTGQPVEMPKVVTWDGDTQSTKDLEWQAGSIASAVEEWIGDRKILDKEIEYKTDEGVSGHIDLMVRDYREGVVKISIVDLKTGHRKPGSTVWTQLAVYAWLNWYCDVDARRADDVVLLWVPRVRRGESQPVEWDARPARELVNVGRELVQRALSASKNPEVRIPGDHCRYCGIDDCLMRVGTEMK